MATVVRPLSCELRKWSGTVNVSQSQAPYLLHSKHMQAPFAAMQCRTPTPAGGGFFLILVLATLYGCNVIAAPATCKALTHTDIYIYIHIQYIYIYIYIYGRSRMFAVGFWRLGSRSLDLTRQVI